MVYRQPEIDLMFWQYCMGVLDVANQLSNAQLDTLNALAEGRFQAISKMHHIAPSFRVQYDQHVTHFSIKKLPV